MVYKIFNDTYPAVVEGHGERLYFIPYEYQTQFAPEKWWHDLDHVSSIRLQCIQTVRF